MALIRAFIALEVSKDARETLRRFSQQLASGVEPGLIRWVKPESIHLTLKFLGEVETQGLPFIEKGLDVASLNQPSFELSLGTLGCFPNPRKPRVLWIGLKGDVDRLIDLYQSVEENMDQIGWKPDKRRFFPHLTIGRIKNTRTSINTRIPFGQPVRPSSVIDVNAIHLIQSTLLPTGAQYSTLYTSYLQ